MATWRNLVYYTNEFLTATKMGYLDENFDALMEGVSGSPLFQTNSFDTDSVTAAKLDDASIIILNLVFAED